MYNRRSYNRGRRGMTFKFKTPKRRKFRSIAPSPITNSGGSAARLNIARIVIIVLIAAVIVAAIVIGMNIFGNTADRATSSDYANSEKSHNAELLRVVNKSNPLDKNYVPELVDKDGYRLNVLAENSLDKLLSKAKKDGVSLYVKYAYVSYDEQKKLYDTEYKSLIKNEGLTEVKAQAKTNLTIPQAGRSEFQTGLMVSFRSQEKGKFKNSKASDWLFKNAKEYGFVLRYPEDKEAETSMNANFKSYRYVGKENAEVMQSCSLTLFT